MGFTGEIMVVSMDVSGPIDKSKLWNHVKGPVDYKSFEMRPASYLESFGFDFYPGRELKAISNKRGNYMVELDDGSKLEYDALVIATGVSPEIGKYSKITGLSNVIIPWGIEEHRKFMEEIPNSKNIVSPFQL